MRWRVGRLVSVLATVAVVGAYGLQWRPARAQEAPEPLAQLTARFGIPVTATEPGLPVPTRYGWVEGRVAGEEDVALYAPLLAQELGLYPPDLVRRSRLRRVVLCTDLAFAKQRRNAVPDFEHDVLYLEVSRGKYNRTYLRKVIHHEFFHVVDYRDDGALYQDPAWAMLNTPGFRYGAGGANAQSQSATSVLTRKYPGFLNHYSTTGVEEDKAEMFANLLVSGDYVAGRAREEPVLAAKVARLKALVAAFCPSANAAFWEAARALPRPN